MTIGVLICSLITLIGVVFIIIGSFKRNGDPLIFTGIITLVLVGMFGWALANSTFINHTEEKKIDVEVVFTSNTIIVEYEFKGELKHKIYRNVAEFNIIKDYKLDWTLATHYNQYNNPRFHNIIYEIVEEVTEKNIKSNIIEKNIKSNIIEYE